MTDANLQLSVRSTDLTRSVKYTC